MKKRNRGNNVRSKKFGRKSYLESLESRLLLFGGGDSNADIVGPASKNASVLLDVDLTINEGESEDDPIDERVSNNNFATAELIPLGFDPGEFDAIDIRGRLIEPNSIGAALGNEVQRPNWVPIDDGAIHLATPVPYSTGTPIEMSGAIGDSPAGFNRDGTPFVDPAAGVHDHDNINRGGDGDFYELLNVDAGQVITAHVRSTPDVAVILYNVFGEILAQNDNTDSIGEFTGVFQDDFISYQVLEDGDYYVAVVPAYGAGFNAPKNPYDPSSIQQSSGQGTYVATIGVDALDIDNYAVDLVAGDVLGLNVLGAANLLAVYGPDGDLLIRSGQDSASLLYPENSPLPYGGAASLGYVATTTGRYAVEVTGYVDAGYKLETRLFRPRSEASAAGEKQILFLDFDGAEINPESLFGPPSLATLSPLRRFLSAWELRDESDLISRIVAVVEENLVTDLEEKGLNTNFQLEIRNSRDHADPYGQPNVSRIIIGGTVAESTITTIGVAQSIDVGNFNLEEGAIVLLDLLSAVSTDPNSLNQFPIAPGANKADLVATGVGNIVSHEAGHFYGAYHTEQTNGFPNLMDQGGDLPGIVGIGADRTWGTQDDRDVDFVDDVFVANERWIGRQNTLQTLAFALNASTATVGGGGGTGITHTGVIYEDRDGNGARNSGEPGLAGVRVYLDRNGDNEFGIGELSTFSDASGNYAFRNASPSEAVRIVVPPGLLLISPEGGEHSVDAETLDFGVQRTEGNNRGIDRSDAPSSYGEATHGIVSGLRLGDLIDGELTTISDDGADDDGVTVSEVVPGRNASATIVVNTGTQSPAALQAWIDFNGDGRFSANEQIVKDQLLLAGSTTLSFAVPASARLGETYARVRYGYERGIGPVGAAVAGEVEDYLVTIVSGDGTGPVDPVDPTSAVNDAMTINQGSSAVTINVLSNDTVGTGTLLITAVGNPSSGGSVNVSGDGRSVVYTPSSPAFVGTETFTYTASNGQTSDTATVTVTVQRLDSGIGDLVRFRLATVDAGGNPISQVNVGDAYSLQVFTQDLRPTGIGVFAGYVDVTFDPALTSTTGNITFGPMYPAGQTSDNTVDGMLNEVGAFAGITNQLGTSELLLFSIPLVADAAGVITFASDPADVLPAHQVLLGDIVEGIPADRIDFTSTSLTVLQPTPQRAFTNPLNPFDVNNDGFVTPVDALIIINELNASGAKKLSSTASPVSSGRFIDVSGDLFLSSIDALMVINRLNASNIAAAEPSSIAAAVDAAFDSSLADDDDDRLDLFGDILGQV